MRRSGVFGARVARELFDGTAVRAGPPWATLTRAGARSEASALAGPFSRASTSAAAAAICKAVIWTPPNPAVCAGLFRGGSIHVLCAATEAIGASAHRLLVGAGRCGRIFPDPARSRGPERARPVDLPRVRRPGADDLAVDAAGAESGRARPRSLPVEPADLQAEHVRTRVMTRDVQGPARLLDALEVAVRVEDPALAAQRTGRDLSHRVDHHAIARVHPLLRIGIDLLAAWQPGRHVAPLDAIGGSRHPTTRLAGDVMHCGQPAFAVVPGGREIEGYALPVERRPRQPHVGFPADQCGRPCRRRVHH